MCANLILRMSVSTPNIFFFFNDTATTEIYTLSLHDALPISVGFQLTEVLTKHLGMTGGQARARALELLREVGIPEPRSEEHTSELQSQSNLVCRLLLEKKNTSNTTGRTMHRAADVHAPSASY